MAKINFQNKDLNSTDPAIGYVRDSDLNEIKQVVNENDDATTAAQAAADAAQGDADTAITNAATAQAAADAAQADIDAVKAGVPSAGDTLNKLYNLITAMGRPRGGFDASSGAVPGPAADNEAGDFWRITVGGTIGTMVLKPGDLLVADIDDAAVAADFYAVQANVEQATDTILGLTKLFPTTSGNGMDGAPTQFAVNAAIGGIQQDQETLKIYKMSNFGTP